jgi:cell division septum initiation protein DivIVA
MTNDSDLMPDLDQEDAFEVQMRGYSRRQVDEFVARTRSQIRDLEERLSHSLDDLERLRLELSAARQGLSSKPAHEEISERVGQILKLADEEAKAQRSRAQDEIGKQREDAKKETDRFRTEAREQTERMLTAAQEQAEKAIASARAEAEKTRNSARLESERAVGQATKEAETSLATAKSQAKQMLDEATMRASAIHDGAERRLNLLTSRHTETMRRLTEIRDVVTNLVASETARGSLEEEVNKSVASSLPGGGQAAPQAAARQAGPASPGAPAEGRHTPPAAQGARAGVPAGQAVAADHERSAPEPARPAAPHVGQHVGTSHGGQAARTAPATTEDRSGAAAKPPQPRTPAAPGPGATHASGERVTPE